MRRVYLDYAAATPMDRRVLEEMMPYLTTAFGNPSSLHYFGQQARAAVQEARRRLAAELGVAAGDIVFTSGGTEADNLAVLGYLQRHCPQGGHIITTSVEHQAVLHTFQELARRGYEVTFLPVDSRGCVDVAAVEKAIRDDTVLLSIMYANNETGAIQPIREIGELTQARGIVFHVDAVQAFGYIPIHPAEEHIDLLTLCSHKIYGPKGVGALYVRPGLALAAAAYGGPQEHRLRAGTENVAAIAGFGKAVALLGEERAERSRQAWQLKQYMYEQLLQGHDRFHLNGDLSASLPNILNFSVSHSASDVLLVALDLAGVAVSAGSACAAGALEASHVLTAMGIEDKWLHSSLRVSFGRENTKADVDYAVQVLHLILEEGGKS